MRRFWQKLSSFVWWNYPRGSLEYDIMVGLILAFLFLTPRHFFQDQPRPFRASPVEITLLGSSAGHLYQIRGAGPRDDLAELLRHYLGHPVMIRKIQVLHRQHRKNPVAPSAIYDVWTN